MTRRSDLPESTLNSGAVLHCSECGESFSATHGDYFMVPEDYVFECCGEPMSLVVPTTTYRRFTK